MKNELLNRKLCEIQDIGYEGFADYPPPKYIKQLVERGASVDAISSYGETSLVYACENGLLDFVKILIECGADINQKKDNYYGSNTILHDACERGLLELVELLIEKGAKLDVLNTYHVTPLYYAIKGNFLDIAKLLIDAGSRDCGKDEDLLKLAVEEKNIDFIDYFIEKFSYYTDYNYRECLMECLWR